MIVIKDWEKFNLCSNAIDGINTISCHKFVLDFQRWEEVWFVAASVCWLSNLCLIIEDGKKYDLFPPTCVRSSETWRSTTCCHHSMLDWQWWEEVRFVATKMYSIIRDGRSTICCHQFVFDCQWWGKSMTCCHQFVFDCQRWDGSTIYCHQFLRDCQRWQESTIYCHWFVFDSQRWEEIRLLPSICV